MILKSVSESIFLQSNKFTECKADRTEVENSVMVYNLLEKSIHFEVRSTLTPSTWIAVRKNI